jgi:hypothetical protein
MVTGRTGRGVTQANFVAPYVPGEGGGEIVERGSIRGMESIP